jgi:hypothetical protein
MRRSPTIVPPGGDQDIYLVLNDFGDRLGRSWAETDEEDTSGFGFGELTRRNRTSFAGAPTASRIGADQWRRLPSRIISQGGP